MTTFLVEFLFRLSFGVAAAMAVTPPRHVTSGFYRVHLWVLLGVNTLASLLVMTVSDSMPQSVFLLATATAALAYCGSVVWLYEKVAAGRIVLLGMILLSATSTVLVGKAASQENPTLLGWGIVDGLTGGLAIGFPLTAMFLGHWYLNTPTMNLLPLKRLVRLIVATTLLRAVVCGIAIAFLISESPFTEHVSIAWLSLRWLSGVVGVLLAAGMTWQTLKIPNTQSATGLLYVAVILVFLGELTSQLLSSSVGYPL